MAEPTKTFWQRHPGFDVYSLFWLVLFLILAALGRFYLPLFSKNQQKRQVENARFIALFRSIFRWFRGRKVLQTDKEYYYFKCPTCGQSMRLPRGLGKVEITCRSCASRFETKS